MKMVMLSLILFVKFQKILPQNMKLILNYQVISIKQDVKNGQLRHFKYGKMPFNYGALPQTWEDPRHIDPGMKLGGDNDPVDVVELSPAPLKHGVVYPIKVVGALALIDEGEVDWKLLGIHADSPIATKLDDVNHIDAFLPAVETKLKD
eukprot:UN02066